MINSNEREILRSLAKKVAEYAELPIMNDRRDRWIRHNRLEKGKPMILVFPEGAWHELVPKTSLQCESDLAREIEWKLRARIFRHEVINDDFVVEKDYHVMKHISHTGWGVEPAQSLSNNSSGSEWGLDSFVGCVPKVWDKNFKFNSESFAFEPVIQSPSDLKKIKYPEVVYDEAKSLKEFDVVQDLFGDILNVKHVGINRIHVGLMEFYCFLRGLEQVLYDMYDEPEMLHEAMSILEEGNRRLIKQYEEMNLFSLNNDGMYHATGGVGYSSELPKSDFDGKKVRACDIWGSAQSQEMAQVSPEMHYEFVMQYEKNLLEMFALNGYGCCEPLDNKLHYVFEMPNIRRISISSWSDVKKCAEQIKDKYIFSWKPNPAHLAMEFDEELIRGYIKDALENTKDCIIELVMKDNHTCQNEPERFTKWVKIARELIDESY